MLLLNTRGRPCCLIWAAGICTVVAQSWGTLALEVLCQAGALDYTRPLLSCVGLKTLLLTLEINPTSCASRQCLRSAGAVAAALVRGLCGARCS